MSSDWKRLTNFVFPREIRVNVSLASPIQSPLEAALIQKYGAENVKIIRKIQIKTRPRFQDIPSQSECRSRTNPPKRSTESESAYTARFQKSCQTPDKKCHVETENDSMECIPKTSLFSNEVLLVHITHKTRTYEYVAKAVFENQSTMFGTGEQWKRSVKNEISLQINAAKYGLAPKISFETFLFNLESTQTEFAQVNGISPTRDVPAQPNGKYYIRSVAMLMEYIGSEFSTTLTHTMIRVPDERAMFRCIAALPNAITTLITKAKVLHKDLHLQNIRIVREFDVLRPIFIDFGIAQRFYDNDPQSTNSIVQQHVRDVFDEILKYGLPHLEPFIETVRFHRINNFCLLLQRLTSRTTWVETKTHLFHTLGYMRGSSTGYEDDTAYGSARSFFNAKTRAVPAIFFSPNAPLDNHMSRDVLEMHPIETIYNVLNIDALNGKVRLYGDTEEEFKHFNGLLEILTRPEFHFLWSTNVETFMNYVKLEQNESNDRDMFVLSALGTIFNGWVLLNNREGLEPQIMLLSNVIKTQLTFVNTPDTNLQMVEWYENNDGVDPERFLDQSTSTMLSTLSNEALCAKCKNEVSTHDFFCSWCGIQLNKTFYMGPDPSMTLTSSEEE